MILRPQTRERRQRRVLCQGRWWAGVSVTRIGRPWSEIIALLKVGQDLAQFDALHAHEGRPRCAAYSVDSTAGRLLVLEYEHIQRLPAWSAVQVAETIPGALLALGRTLAVT